MCVIKYKWEAIRLQWQLHLNATPLNPTMPQTPEPPTVSNSYNSRKLHPNWVVTNEWSQCPQGKLNWTCPRVHQRWRQSGKNKTSSSSQVCQLHLWVEVFIVSCSKFYWNSHHCFSSISLVDYQTRRRWEQLLSQWHWPKIECLRLPVVGRWGCCKPTGTQPSQWQLSFFPFSLPHTHTHTVWAVVNDLCGWEEAAGKKITPPTHKNISLTVNNPQSQHNS